MHSAAAFLDAAALFLLRTIVSCPPSTSH
jgi:hypothetical protein